MAIPEYVYGGNGMIERPEYNVLRGEVLQEASLNIVTNVEAAIEHSYTNPWVAHAVEQDTNVVKRSVSYTYMDSTQLWDDILLYDSEKGGVSLYESRTATDVQKVSIYHEAYTRGPREESYYIIFDNALPNSNGSFTSTYGIEFFKGGSVIATVTANNISIEEDDTSVFYQRLMTPYDFTALLKRVNEIDTHFSIADIRQ